MIEKRPMQLSAARFLAAIIALTVLSLIMENSNK